MLIGRSSSPAESQSEVGPAKACRRRNSARCSRRRRPDSRACRRCPARTHSWRRRSPASSRRSRRQSRRLTLKYTASKSTPQRPLRASKLPLAARSRILNKPEKSCCTVRSCCGRLLMASVPSSPAAHRSGRRFELPRPRRRVVVSCSCVQRSCERTDGPRALLPERHAGGADPPFSLPSNETLAVGSRNAGPAPR